MGFATLCGRLRPYGISLNGGPDDFGEEHVLKDFEHYLLDAGLGEEEATSSK